MLNCVVIFVRVYHRLGIFHFLLELTENHALSAYVPSTYLSIRLLTATWAALENDIDS